MAKEIRTFQPSGLQLYFVGFRLDPAGDPAVWDQNAGAFVNYVEEAVWTACAVELHEVGDSGFYWADWAPGAAAGVFPYQIRKLLNDAPHQTDEAVGAGVLKWSGSAEVTGIETSVVDLRYLEAVLFGQSSRSGNVVTFKDRAGADRVRIQYGNTPGVRETLTLL